MVDQGSNDVTPVDLATQIGGTAIPVGIFPTEIAITPNGTKAYVTNQGETTVTPIDLTTNTPGSSITVGDFPTGVAVTPDGLIAYVANQGAGVAPVGLTPINTVTDVPGTFIPFPDGSSLFSLAITPDQSPVARFTVTSAQAGSPTTFDASGSVSPVGTIVSYIWNFGDGAVLTTSTPITTHTYAAAGNYIVTLTVVNSAGTSTTQVFTGQTMSRNGGPLAAFAQFITIFPAPPAPPTVTSVVPNQGPTTGGNVVTINGTNFTGAIAVKFGSTPALSFIVVSDSVIVAIAPPGVPSTVDVTVTNPIGTSPFTPADLYTYIFAPPAPSTPLPPSDFRGKTVKNKFATQIEYIHHLKWVPSPDPTVVGYKLFRNGHLIAVIPAEGPFKFHDHNRKKRKRDLYVLQSFNANGLLSIPLTVTLPKG